MNNVVVSPHYLSTELGSSVFKKGGNAVDAAIATNLVQGIVAPETCGIGGDLFALIWIPGKSKPEFLDASGYAGSLVNLESLANYENIPLNHPLSVTIPGTVAGWTELSNKYGNISINEILGSGDLTSSTAKVFLSASFSVSICSKTGRTDEIFEFLVS